MKGMLVMKSNKLLAKSITLGLILAMPYSVVSANDIEQESYSVGSTSTVTGKDSIKISGSSYIAGKLGNYNNKQLGAKNFTTGQLILDPTGVIYVDKLETTSESVISIISGKIYANNIEFNNAKVSFNKSAEIIAENSLTITTSESITNNSKIVADTITMNNYLTNKGSITAKEKLTTKSLHNSGSVSGKKLITPGGLTNGDISAGTNPDAMLNFVDIDTRYIINTGKIEAQTIENDLNISNMGEMTINEKMTVEGVLKNDEDAVITAKNIIIKQDSDASGSDTTSVNKGSMTVNAKLELQNGANFSFENGIGTSVNINNLQGDGNNKLNIAAGTTGIQVGTANLINGNITVNDLTKDQITIGTNNSTGLQVTGTSNATKRFNSSDLAGSMQQLVDTVGIGTGNQLDSALAQESDILPEITALVDDNGNVIINSIRTKGHVANEGITELANVAFMAWRAENYEMHQRMGELRSSNGEAGIWARMKRGESKYGDMDIKNQYSTYRLGYDKKVGDSNWYIGGAISRTEGKSSFATGSGENQSTGFTVYGTYVADDGQYVDLSAKYARLDNEFDVFGRSGIESTGDYRNNGYAFSAEYGKRIEAGNDFWIEPQVQLTYGHLSGANYTTSRGVRVTQDAMDSVVGRLGFAAGKDIGAGNVYVKASYLYDFDGDTNVKMTDGINSAVYDQDLGGGWFEVGIGTNINLSETSHLYFDVEKTYGGDIETPWQWNAGVRFDF